jgi:hypothetical protein
MLKGIMICQRCIGGQVVRNAEGEFRCIQCNAPHKENGELIRPQIAEPVKWGKRSYPTKRALR